MADSKYSAHTSCCIDSCELQPPDIPQTLDFWHLQTCRAIMTCELDRSSIDALYLLAARNPIYFTS